MKREPSQHTKISWLIVKFCFVIMVLLCPCIASADSDAGPSQRLAILSSKEVQESGLSDLLTFRLQNLPGVELVERDLLKKWGH